MKGFSPICLIYASNRPLTVSCIGSYILTKQFIRKSFKIFRIILKYVLILRHKNIKQIFKQFIKRKNKK